MRSPIRRDDPEFTSPSVPDAARRRRPIGPDTANGPWATKGFLPNPEGTKVEAGNVPRNAVPMPTQRMGNNLQRMAVENADKKVGRPLPLPPKLLMKPMKKAEEKAFYREYDKKWDEYMRAIDAFLDRARTV